jgi:hypothetical protein
MIKSFITASVKLGAVNKQLAYPDDSLRAIFSCYSPILTVLLSDTRIKYK